MRAQWTKLFDQSINFVHLRMFIEVFLFGPLLTIQIKKMNIMNMEIRIPKILLNLNRKDC